jgi:hypothetical protein
MQTSGIVYNFQPFIFQFGEQNFLHWTVKCKLRISTKIYKLHEYLGTSQGRLRSNTIQLGLCNFYFKIY